MKSELTQENRLRFESLYVGQDVFRSSKEPDESGILTPRLLARPASKYDWLSLKPLSKISDEDAINIAILEGCDEGCSLEFKLSLGKCRTNKDHPLGRNVFTQPEADYLRSRGYALPWMGLSVDELIEAGWIRLTES